MYEVRYFQDDDGSVPVADYIASLDQAGRGVDAARMLNAIDLLAEIGMPGAQQLGTSFSRLIDRELRIWELRPGGHRVAYAAIADELVLLHAWKKGRQRLDSRALQRAQRNCWRARSDIRVNVVPGRNENMATPKGPTHAEVRERLLHKGSSELREEYARLAPRRAAIAALVRARTQRKLTQHELAERMGVSQGVISRLESGAHSPKLETLDQAARAMDFRLDIRLVDNRRSRAAARRD